MNNLVLQLRYIGVIPQTGYREYGFRLEDKESGERIVVLTIEDEMFRSRNLMLQEAPDLCYQKLLTDLRTESAGAHIPPMAQVTLSDIAIYRDAHPTGKRPGTWRRH